MNVMNVMSASGLLKTISHDDEKMLNDHFLPPRIRSRTERCGHGFVRGCDCETMKYFGDVLSSVSWTPIQV